MIIFGLLFIFASWIDASLCQSYVELNHDLSSETAFWPTPSAVPVTLTSKVYEGLSQKGIKYTAKSFCASEHSGTHIDAPSHFAEHSWTVDQIPLENLFAPVAVIDVREKVKKNMVYQLSAKDVVEWVDENGLLPNNSVVLIHTGWSSRYPNKSTYFGHSTDSSKFTFPGVSVGAVQTLLGYKKASDIQIVGIGIDTPSLDHGPSVNLFSHQETAAHNVYILENLKSLEKVPTRGAELIVMPMKIKGGSGAPCRVVAKIWV